MSSDREKSLNPAKRQRVPVSCVVCRKRKIKCDRKKPFCSSCVRSGAEALCSYSKPAWIHSQGNAIIGATASDDAYLHPHSPDASAASAAAGASSTSFPHASSAPSFSVGHAALHAAKSAVAGSSAKPDQSPSAATPPSIASLLASNESFPVQESGPHHRNGSAQFAHETVQKSASGGANSGNRLSPPKVTHRQKPRNTAAAASPAPTDLVVHKEIEQLKDRINRLQASLYMTELSKSSNATTTVGSRHSPLSETTKNFEAPVGGRGHPEAAANRRLSSVVSNNGFINNTLSPFKLNQRPQNVVTQHHELLPSAAASPLKANDNNPPTLGPGIQDFGANSKQSSINTQKDSYLDIDLANLGTPAPMSGWNFSSPKFNIVRPPNTNASQGANTNNYGAGNNFNSAPIESIPNNVSLQANVGLSNSSNYNNTLAFNNLAKQSERPEQRASMAQRQMEFNIPDGFFDNLLRSFQKGDFFNLTGEESSPFMYSVPISLSNNFTPEEGEVTLDLRKNNQKSKLPTFQDFSFVCDESQNILFSVSFNLLWFVFENDFYIKSSLALGCSEIWPFLQHVNSWIVNSSEISKRFITNEEELKTVSSYKPGLNVIIDTCDLRIMRNCIRANMGSNRKFIEPMVIRPYSYLMFDPRDSSTIPLSDPRYNVMEELYLKQLFTDIKTHFPNLKVTILLTARFVKTLYHFFPFLDKNAIMISLSELTPFLLEDFDIANFRDYLIGGSVGYTLDTIGIIFVVLKIAYTIVIDRIREKLYESNFDASVLESAERYLLNNHDVSPDQYIHIAKSCFSYHFSFDNIYVNFHKIDFALKKIQLGLFLLSYSTFFEDQVRHGGLFFKAFTSPVGNKDNDGKDELFPFATPESDLTSPSKPAHTPTASRSAPDTCPLHRLSSEAIDGDFYTKDMVFSVTTDEFDLRRKKPHNTPSPSGNFSVNSKDFLLVVQNLLADMSNTFATLVDFASALKLDKDPMDYIDLNLTFSYTANFKATNEISETLSTIRTWRLCWLEIIHFDKTCSMTMGKKPIIDDQAYEDKLKTFVNASDNYEVESSEAKIRVNTLAKRNKAHTFICTPIFRLNERLVKMGGQVKLKDYLSIVKSIDNFVEFNNDYKLGEIFDFIDGFQKRYPIYFENPGLLSDDQLKEYYEVEARSINKNFEVVHSLYWNVLSTSTQFTIYYSLFCHLDRLICFERSNNDVPIFKKVFMNTESIINDFIKLVRKVLETKRYRRFICSHFKSLFKRAVEPMLFSLFIHQHGIIIRLSHTLKLLQDYVKNNLTHPKIEETTEKIKLFSQLQDNIVNSAAELLKLFKAINNFDKEPEQKDLSAEQLDTYEKINQHSYRTCTLFSSEAISFMSFEHALVTGIKLNSIDDMLDSEIGENVSESSNLLELNNVKLKKFGTVNGQNIILPNFNSFLYFDNNELSYISNELMKDFYGKGSNGPTNVGLTPSSADGSSASG